MATTKKQRTTMNVIMVVLAIVVVAAGAFFVVSVRGGQSQDSPFTVSQKTGYANIERAGLSYVLDKETALQDGDQIETLNGSELGILADKSGTVYLADASKMSVRLDEAAGNALALENGSTFVDVNGESLNLESLDLSWTSQDAVCVLSARTGSTTLQVMSGEVACSDGVNVKAGESYSVTADQSSKGGANKVTTLSIESLDAFALEHALDALGSGRTLCFTEKQITDVQESRAAEREQMAKDAAAASSSSSAASSDESALEANDESLAEGGAPAEGSSDTETSYATDETQVTEYESQDYTPEETETTYAEDSATEPEVQESVNNVYTCTIQIRCDTILNNMDQLAEGKSKYVPKNGILLASSTVNFTEGETAFDVLKAVCDQAGISLEYSYAPVYGSYYIEGIGNLYEFDCGDESGWMYKVNGWFPNYGCSEYALSDGDAVTFCYTCKGLGDDVGA